MTEPRQPPSTAAPQTQVRRRRRWCLVVAVLVCLCIVFLPQVVLVQWGPRLLGSVLSKQLHTFVTVEGVAGGWLHGIELRGIEIAESPQPQAPPLLRLERLTLNLAALWLLASSEPIALRLEELTVNLRRSEDGRWNIAALLAQLVKPIPSAAPEPSAAPKPSKRPAFTDRRLDFILTGGQLHMGDDGTTYRFDLHGESPSLAQAPWQWQFALSGADGAALTFHGQLHHVASPQPLEGYADVNVSHLDVEMVTPLLPLHAAWPHHGYIHQGHVRLGFDGTQGVNIATSMTFQQLQWPAADAPTGAGLEHLQVRLQGQWQDNHWSCEALTIEAPGGRFELHDRAWMQADEDAWHGHVAFALDVKESQPVAQALQTLLPPALRLQGPLHITAQADGAISRDAQQSWDARLAGLAANLDASLAELTWHQKRFTEIVTRAFLQDGWLRVPQVSVKAFGSKVVLKGDLPLTEDTPGAGLDWHVVNLPLHDVIGKPLQRFVVSQSKGRLSRDGQMYRIESVVQFPELRLDPAALQQREFRITQAVFQCTATLSVPFTHLAFDGCTIASPEMRMTIHQGQLTLAKPPQISMQLTGDLSGGFVNALVPEVPVQFTHPLHISGPYSIPLQGNVWVGMQWDLAVSSARFVFEDMPFTTLRTRVGKGIGRLDLANIRAKRGKGRVEGAGAWRFVKGQPAEGRLQLHLQKLPVERILTRDAAGGPFIIEAAVDGPITVQTGRVGWQIAWDQELRRLHLRQGGTTLADMSAAHVRGLVGREPHDPLWARQLELVGDALKLTIQHGRLPVPNTGPSVFEVDAAVDVQAPWVMAVLSLLQVNGVEVAGQTQATVRMQGKMQSLLQTMQGEGAVQVGEIRFRRQTFTAVDVAYELAAGRVQITKGRGAYGRGRFEVQGSLGLPPRLGTPSDHGVVTLHQIRLEHTKQVEDFRSQGAATLHLRTTVDGHVELQVTSSGELKGVLQGHTGTMTRQVRQGERVLEAVDVPPIHLTSQLSSAHPLEHWELPSLHLGGEGIAVDLTNLQVQRTEAHIDLQGALQVHLSGEMSSVLSRWFLPPAFELKEAVDLVGTAGLRLPVTGPVEPRHISYAGDIRLQRLMIEGDESESLTAHLELAQGRLTVEAARAEVLDGEVRIASTSFVDLQGPGHDFDVHVMAKDLQLRVHSGERLAFSRVLSLLMPLLIMESKPNEPASMSGILEAEFALHGSFSTAPGWSKTVNGKGVFRIVDGAVLGSTLVAGLTTKAVTLPWNVVHNTLTGLFAADGQLGSEIASLGRKAFVFDTLESPIHVQAGVVRLQPNFEVRSPEFSMLINGYSILEGDVNYHVRTDIIERLRFGSITSLPQQLPIIGNMIPSRRLSALLEGIELEATMQGNAFRKNAAGKVDIVVQPTILR